MEQVRIEVDGDAYPLTYDEAVSIAQEMRLVERTDASVRVADRIERVLVDADEGPVQIQGDDENVDVQRYLEVCFLMPGGTRPPHVWDLFNALRRARGDPEARPSK